MTRTRTPWMTAFAEAGIQVDFQKVRCAIGMGGDKLMPAVADIQADSPQGQRISERRSEIFKADYLPHCGRFATQGALVPRSGRGLAPLRASSAKRDELEAC
jgi:hypothetical protein